LETGKKETVFIDGSTGEGGGQILRTSLALSCITGRGLRVENIRASRRNPGLGKQHLSCIKAAAEICGGQFNSVKEGSGTLDFRPGRTKGGDFNFDIGSAGSATLVTQTVLPPLFLAEGPSIVTVTGGTHNPLAPAFDFFSESFLPAIATAGFEADCRLIKHGFFPAGGGKITVGVHRWQKQPGKKINYGNRPGRFRIFARIYTARLAGQIAQRQKRLLLKNKLEIEDIEHIEVTDSDGAGNCVMLLLADNAPQIIFTAFGMRGKPSEKVISEVVNSATHFLSSAAAIDRFLADQVLIYMAMTASGCYTTDDISLHLRTNIEIIEKFLPVKFAIEPKEGLYRVTCQQLQ